MAEEPTLLVQPLDMDAVIVAGSEVIDADCGHLAWLSPGGLEHMRRRPQTRTICVACVDWGPVEIVGLTGMEDL